MGRNGCGSQTREVRGEGRWGAGGLAFSSSSTLWQLCNPGHVLSLSGPAFPICRAEMVPVLGLLLCRAPSEMKDMK